ncbi:MAG TPA: enoyl-CoA hydratase-related protein [Acidimicrobiales bacterium]|nr:enoyl-CoA hydratase-related protein [Acidimicrobiales bacterium]
MLTGDPGSTDPLVVTRDGPIATLWLNRPEKRNAVTKAMWEGIADACRDLAADGSVRVLVVRGAGDHFCAGADIGELEVSDATYARANAGADHALAAFPKPTIAFVRGSCVGGGTQVAIACDLRIADTTAVFGITPARLGIVYPAFAVDRAVRLLGPSATKHLLFSAELIGWERALRIGLVDEVHEPEAVDERLDVFVTLLATQRSLLTQESSKAMVDELVRTGEISDDTVAAWSARLAASDDPAEGVRAFFERRAPRFTWTSR